MWPFITTVQPKNIYKEGRSGVETSLPDSLENFVEMIKNDCRQTVIIAKSKLLGQNDTLWFLCRNATGLQRSRWVYSASDF